MTLGSMTWRGFCWSGAVVAAASMGLMACPGGDGDGGGNCPELAGDWSVSGTCTNTRCELEQSGCSITFTCDDGRTLNGTVSKGSATFSDSDVRCTGSLDGLEDDDGDGTIAPELDGMCTPIAEGDACDYTANCLNGDCTVPDQDEGSDEGGSGEGGSSGEGDSGEGGGAGGQSGGDSGEGGGPAGQGGISGEGGEGGIPPGGSGGVGGVVGGTGGSAGAIDSEACGECILSACETEVTACAGETGCVDVVDCWLETGCSFDNAECLDTQCATAYEGIVDAAGEDAAVNSLLCATSTCGDCLSGSGPVGGTGGSPATECDTCTYANDDVCDDGSDGSEVFCDLGTDCTDCGG